MTTFEPRTAVVRIYQGDYLDRIRHIERKYEAASKSEASVQQTADEVSLAQSLFDEHSALVAEADQSAVDVTLRALGRRRWRALVKDHPPREGNQEDAAAGVNEESFADALVPESIASPSLTEDQLDAISDVDFQRLYVSAFALNRMPVADPKALRVSHLNMENGATSN